MQVFFCKKDGKNLKKQPDNKPLVLFTKPLLIQIATFSTNLISVIFTYEPYNQFYYEQKIYSCSPYFNSRRPVFSLWSDGKE
jgi:hypothetical protein